MSDAKTDHDDHKDDGDHAPTDHAHGEHADDGEVHAHIGSYRLYLTIFFSLIFFTLVTVGVASFHLGAANLAVAVIIASIKAALVCTFFMHLKDDNRFHTLILISAVLFIGVFFAYTTNDTSHRAMLDLQAGSKIDLASGGKAPGAWEAPPLPKTPEKKPDQKGPEKKE